MRTMSRVTVLLAMLACLGGTTSAWAAEGDPPCQEDVQRLCPMVPATGNFVQGCLQEHADELSPDCRKHVGTYTRDTEDLRSACQQDLERHCSNIERADLAGTQEACLARHRDGLSARCLEALEGTSAR